MVFMCWFFTSSDVQKFLALETEDNHSHFYLILVFVPQDVKRRKSKWGSNTSDLDQKCGRRFKRLIGSLNILYISELQWPLQVSIAANSILKCDFTSIQVLFDQFAMTSSFLHGDVVLRVLLQRLIPICHQQSTLCCCKSAISQLYDSHFLS